MKRLFGLGLLSAGLIMSSCNKMGIVPIAAFDELVEVKDGRNCASGDIYNAIIAKDLLVASRRLAMERQTAEFVGRMNKGQVRLSAFNVPVHVNVIYNTTSQNISDAQIQAQIDIINKDFQGSNADFDNALPAGYSSDIKAKMDINFYLHGVSRRESSNTYWVHDDAMKKSAAGGIDASGGGTVLNVWVCPLGGTLLGYATFPGTTTPDIDGAVITTSAFGVTTGNYNLGRTLTHELGHFFNLSHIWGDSRCGNDEVSDTPLQDVANRGCSTLTHRSKCSGKPLELWMNYMDYTYDRCMWMFTNGQKARVYATFEQGGGRAAYNHL